MGCSVQNNTIQPDFHVCYLLNRIKPGAQMWGSELASLDITLGQAGRSNPKALLLKQMHPFILGRKAISCFCFLIFPHLKCSQNSSIIFAIQ